MTKLEKTNNTNIDFDSFKSGYVTILGRPNSGKSTLLNLIIGSKISIVTRKPQTTRKNILGVFTDQNCQMIFFDTPGIHVHKGSKLNELMVTRALGAINEADVILYMVDAKTGLTRDDRLIISKLKNHVKKCIVAINKIDLISKDFILPIIHELSNNYSFTKIVPISAKHEDGIGVLSEEIKSSLLNGPLYYSSDYVTDVSIREICGEIIREKLFKILKQEIPYSVMVEVEKFVEADETQNKKLVEIYATVFVERTTQKAIVIGKNGSMLKKIGSFAREDIEKLVGRQCFLEIFCKVREGWTDDNRFLKEYGF
ncbi:MAG: GTPase Era [Pseudomonadota bacterium]